MTEGIVLAVTGIDTDIGKTIATGLLGRYLRCQGFTVITQKISQTGCRVMSEDILEHRKLMGIGLQDVDRRGLTCPYIFPEPCSPHLAAKLVGRTIDCNLITSATEELRKHYQYVLLEGVGGLSVPLNDEVTLLDYFEQRKYPLILVSSPRLGSINHTLAALELAKGRGLEIRGIIYNRFRVENEAMAEDSANVFSLYLSRFGYADVVVNMLGSREYFDGQAPDFGSLLYDKCEI